MFRGPRNAMPWNWLLCLRPFCLTCALILSLHLHSGLTNTLTLWNWALLGRTPIVQSLDSFQAFCGNRNFITAFTRAIHLPLPWDTNPVHITPSYFSQVHCFLNCFQSNMAPITFIHRAFYFRCSYDSLYEMWQLWITSLWNFMLLFVRLIWFKIFTPADWSQMPQLC
jgi:hypothetical protein